MTKYHVNPATGNPGVCTALSRCRFGGDELHFASQEDARRAYEVKMTLGSDNATTLESYNEAVAEYLAGTVAEVNGGLKNFIDGAFQDVAPGARVLELGSGGGRDARYLSSLGCQVQATDGSEGFVKHLQAEGIKAKKLNIITDPFPRADVVFANATMLHLSRDDFGLAAKKAYGALPGRGLFVFTVKEGAGEGWSSEKIGKPRHFTYWEEKDLQAHVEKAGFQAVEITRDGAFLQVKAHKIQGSKNRPLALHPNLAHGEVAEFPTQSTSEIMNESPMGSTVRLPDGRSFTKVNGFMGDHAWRFNREGYFYDRSMNLEPGQTYRPEYAIQAVGRHGGVLSDD